MGVGYSCSTVCKLALVKIHSLLGKTGSFWLGPTSKNLIDLEASKTGFWRHPENVWTSPDPPKGEAGYPMCTHSAKERRCLECSPVQPGFI